MPTTCAARRGSGAGPTPLKNRRVSVVYQKRLDAGFSEARARVDTSSHRSSHLSNNSILFSKSSFRPLRTTPNTRRKSWQNGREVQAFGPQCAKTLSFPHGSPPVHLVFPVRQALRLPVSTRIPNHGRCCFVDFRVCFHRSFPDRPWRRFFVDSIRGFSISNRISG